MNDMERKIFDGCNDGRRVVEIEGVASDGWTNCVAVVAICIVIHLCLYFSCICIIFQLYLYCTSVVFVLYFSCICIV